MKYDDPNMEHYFRSLPPPVQRLIERSGADICSPGELMLIGEHFKISYGYQEPERKGGQKTGPDPNWIGSHRCVPYLCVAVRLNSPRAP